LKPNVDLTELIEAGKRTPVCPSPDGFHGRRLRGRLARYGVPLLAGEVECMAALGANLERAKDPKLHGNASAVDASTVLPPE
jgi:hypothetical protein